MDFYTFYLRYIELNLKSFDVFGIDFPINQFLLVLMLAFIVAAIFINYNRWIIITTVKKLIRHDALCEENAKTLSELGINSRGIERALKSNGHLTRLVRRAGEYSMSYEEYTKLSKSKSFKEEKIDFSECRLHVREECLEEAKQISLKTDITVLGTVLLSLLIFAIFMCLFFLMPEILSFFNNLSVMF